MRQYDLCLCPPAGGLAPAWRPALLRWLLLAQYVLFGLFLGVQGALWADLRRALALGEGAFGTAMLLTPLVGFGVLQIAGRIWGGHNQRYVSLAALGVIASALTALAMARGLALFLVARTLSGLGYALLDSAVNNAALDWEEATGRQIVSALYAAFSAGAVAGALLAGALLSAGWDYRSALLALVPLWLLMGAATALSCYPPPRRALATAAPRIPLALLRDRRFVVLAALCVVGVFAEALADVWSAIYVRAMGAGALLGSAAFALFSAAMIAGRLANAALVDRWGARAALRCACASAAVAAALLALGGGLGSALGFGVLGLGLAGVVPTVLGASRRRLPDQGATTANGIVAASYLGYVVAAPLIGWLAEALGMRVALPLLLGIVALALSRLSRNL